MVLLSRALSGKLWENQSKMVDATFPFLAFEEPEPQELEDIPIEHF
jgi:hypothetical protein